MSRPGRLVALPFGRSVGMVVRPSPSVGLAMVGFFLTITGLFCLVGCSGDAGGQVGSDGGADTEAGADTLMPDGGIDAAIADSAADVDGHASCMNSEGGIAGSGIWAKAFPGVAYLWLDVDAAGDILLAGQI